MGTRSSVARVTAALVAAAAAEQDDEQVDDVQVELQCAGDVLLWTERKLSIFTTDHSLSVKDQ